MGDTSGEQSPPLEDVVVCVCVLGGGGGGGGGRGGVGVCVRAVDGVVDGVVECVCGGGWLETWHTRWSCTVDPINTVTSHWVFP